MKQAVEQSHKKKKELSVFVSTIERIPAIHSVSYLQTEFLSLIVQGIKKNGIRGKVASHILQRYDSTEVNIYVKQEIFTSV